jgi:hypothetical protein
MTPLSLEIRAEAKSLAERITNGEFNELTESQRIDLRTLTLRMAGWADQVEEVGDQQIVVQMGNAHIAGCGGSNG